MDFSDKKCWWQIVTKLFLLPRGHQHDKHVISIFYVVNLKLKIFSSDFSRWLWKKIETKMDEALYNG